MPTLTITFEYTEKALKKKVSFCFKHSNNWKEVSYPYFPASSFASSSFTTLWSSRSLLFPHNTMSGFSQYACICSWPNSNNINRGHNLLSHMKLTKNTTTFQGTRSPSGKWLFERQKTVRSLAPHRTSAIALRSQRTGGHPLSRTQWKSQGSRSLTKLAWSCVFVTLGVMLTKHLQWAARKEYTSLSWRMMASGNSSV